MKNNYEKYRSAWLIGSAGGIGQSLSKVLSEYVDKISFCDMKNSPIVMNEKSNFLKINCADDKQFRKFADESVKMFGAPDLMLITAGHVSSAELINTSPDELDKIYLNNFKLVSIALKLFFEKCLKENHISKNIIIAPGTVAVDRNIVSLKKQYPDFPIDDSRPLGKIAFPEDLHPAFKFLLEKNLLMTGQILLIDGGSSLV